MSDFLKELFETYYKEQKRKDKIELLERENEFLNDVIELRFQFNYDKIRERMSKNEQELKLLRGEK